MVFFCFVGLPILALVDGGATECKVPLADISDELIIPDRCVFDAETPPPILHILRAVFLLDHANETILQLD